MWESNKKPGKSDITKNWTVILVVKVGVGDNVEENLSHNLIGNVIL
jgi:hypothetical protein